MTDTDTGNPGFASKNYPDKKAEQVHRMGGEASGGNTSGTSNNKSGAAGKTDAAKRGGQNSRRSS